MELKTHGLSPKAVLAFVFPLIVTIATTLSSWIATGDFSDTELRTALSGFLLSSVSALGAYLGSPGTVTAVEVGPASDDLLPPEARDGLLKDTVGS